MRKYIGIAIAENIPLDKIAVFPDFLFLAISLVVQYDIIGSSIKTYPVNPPIKLHVPNSSCESSLVIINVKINPVSTPTNPIENDINPE